MKKFICLFAVLLGSFTSKPYDLLLGKVGENGKVHVATYTPTFCEYNIGGSYKPGDVVKIRYRNYCGNRSGEIETLHSVELVEGPEELLDYLD